MTTGEPLALAPVVARSPADDEAVLAAGSKSFYWASRVLPKDVRRDVAALYTFCRYVDDVADESPDRAWASVELDRVLAELDGDAEPRPVVANLLSVAHRRGLDIDAARCLVAAVQDDLDDVRVSNLGGLTRYCYGVAGTVGLMMCSLIGVTDRRARPHAIDLGIAMQLTNICRDVAEDAERGRVYLPKTLLRHAGVRADDVVDGYADRHGVQSVIEVLLQIADLYYASAERGMRAIPVGPRLAILVAARVYRRIGDKLRRRGTRWWRGRTVVSALEKTWVTLGALARFPFLPRRDVHARGLHVALRGLPGSDVRTRTP